MVPLSKPVIHFKYQLKEAIFQLFSTWEDSKRHHHQATALCEQAADYHAKTINSEFKSAKDPTAALCIPVTINWGTLWKKQHQPVSLGATDNRSFSL